MDWMKAVAWFMFYTILMRQPVIIFIRFFQYNIYLFSTDVITSNWFKSSVTVFKISDITKYFT